MEGFVEFYVCQEAHEVSFPAFYLTHVWLGSNVSAKFLPSGVRPLAAHVKLTENCQGAGHARSELPCLESLVGREQLGVVAVSGGKLILANHPLDSTTRSQPPAGLRFGSYRTQSHGRVESKDLAFPL